VEGSAGVEGCLALREFGSAALPGSLVLAFRSSDCTVLRRLWWLQRQRLLSRSGMLSFDSISSCEFRVLDAVTVGCVLNNFDLRRSNQHSSFLRKSTGMWFCYHPASPAVSVGNIVNSGFNAADIAAIVSKQGGIKLNQSYWQSVILCRGHLPSTVVCVQCGRQRSARQHYLCSRQGRGVSPVHSVWRSCSATVRLATFSPKHWSQSQAVAVT